MPPVWLYQIAGIVLGLLFGSFLNVCIARLPQHESVITPRSRCLHCSTTIRWYDNMPVLSWLLLRGRCRECRAPIAWHYPLVEFGTGAWFWLCVNTSLAAHSRSHDFGGSFTDNDAQQLIVSFSLAILGFLLIGLMVMDWQTLHLPDAFTLTGIAIGFFLICTQTLFLGPTEGQVRLANHHITLRAPGSGRAEGNLFLTGTEALIFGRIAAICGAALILLLIRWGYKAARKREGMGLGDVKLIAMIAAFLGFSPAIVALFAGTLAASVYGVVLLARGRANGLTKLAFGSFLSAGGLFAALFGNRLIEMYTALLR